MDAGLALSFLTEVTAACPDDQYGYLWVSGQGRKKTIWFPIGDDLRAVADRAVTEAENADVYFGVATTPQPGTEYERAKNDNVSGIYGFYADIDWAAENAHKKKKTYPPNKEAALEVASMVGLAPTLIVNSGYGLHAWWLFDEFWLFADDDDRQEAQALAEAWQRTIAVRAAEQNLLIDMTFDFARILRVPGTLNHKGGGRQDVGIEQRSGVRISREDLSEFIIPESAIAAMGIRSGRDYIVGEFILDSEAEGPAEKIEALKANHDSFKATWDRKRTDFADQSASSYDLSLATIAAGAGWSDQEIIDTLIQQRRRFQDDLKLRPDYYRRTLKKAHEASAADAARAELGEAVEDLEDALASGDDESAKEHRRKVCDHISALTGFEVMGMSRYLTPPDHEYAITIGVHTVHLGVIANLTNQGKFRDTVLSSDVAVMMNPFERSDWLDLVGKLRSICVDIDVGVGATEMGRMESYVQEFLLQRKLCPDVGDAMRSMVPFLSSEGNVCIFPDVLANWVHTQRNDRVEPKKIRRLLRQMGAKPRVMSFKTVSGSQSSRETWELPPEFART